MKCEGDPKSENPTKDLLELRGDTQLPPMYSYYEDLVFFSLGVSGILKGKKSKGIPYESLQSYLLQYRNQLKEQPGQQVVQIKFSRVPAAGHPRALSARNLDYVRPPELGVSRVMDQPSSQERLVFYPLA